ncbi:MAG: hypothetical protein Q7U57_06675, partial [Methylovulum sp.]|nr:hypothetical protein [Methylovulum sp.]
KKLTRWVIAYWATCFIVVSKHKNRSHLMQNAESIKNALKSRLLDRVESRCEYLKHAEFLVVIGIKINNRTLFVKQRGKFASFGNKTASIFSSHFS